MSKFLHMVDFIRFLNFTYRGFCSLNHNKIGLFEPLIMIKVKDRNSKENKYLLIYQNKTQK